MSSEKLNPFVLGLVAGGALALLSAYVFSFGLADALDYTELDWGEVVFALVLVLISAWTGVLALLSAAVLAGIGWQLRRARLSPVDDDEARPAASLLDAH